ncbi:MAG: aldehyde dehydrogenase family protein [Aggregatilineales bacterium]
MLNLPEEYIRLHPDVEAMLTSERQLYIGGRFVPAQSSKTFTSIDPSTEQIIAHVSEGDKADVDLAVRAARRAFEGDWRHKLTASERSKLIWRLADLIEERSEILAQLDSLDTGKPYQTTLTSDVPLSAEHFRYYAGFPTKIEGATIPVSTPGMFNYTLREPIGVCGLIVPWNYPLLMASWKIAPALAAGNCIILKPAEQTPLSALYLAQLFEEAGFPPGVFNVINGFGSVVGATLVEHAGVNKIGFTGSVATAKTIIRASADTLKRVSLELGGKSPNIVFADADLDKASIGATWAIFGNNGQSCTAGARLYIERKVFDKVVQNMADEVSKINVGPGMNTQQPTLGPVISETQMKRVMGYVEDGFQGGAEAVTGGKRLTDTGYFIEPTIFVNTRDDMKINREEIFGPVVCAMPFDDADDILKRANNTDFGLAAGLWTSNLSKAHRFAAALQAGTIWINTWGDTDAASPFGGYKQSGHGREMGKEAIDLYSEVKSVWIKTDG